MSNHFVTVGGGTAGWLGALMLQDALKRLKRNDTLTVIESSWIPTIGVGEGTTAIFRQMLSYFGINEFEFLRETEATIKFGIRHKDWRRVGHSYDGPIDDPHLVVAEDRILLDWQRIGRQLVFTVGFIAVSLVLRRVLKRVNDNDRWYVALIWLAGAGFVADWSGLRLRFCCWWLLS